MSGTTAILGEDDLIGWQGHLYSVSEDDRYSRGPFRKIGSFGTTSGSRLMRVPGTNSMSSG